MGRAIPALLLACSLALAQSPGDQPSFEVVSVKLAQPPHPGSRLVPLRGGPGTNTPTRLRGDASFKTLLLRAYRVKSYQVSGPDWIGSEGYEIVAEIAPGTTEEQADLMLQNLLRERFQLKVHRESKELPGYVLLVGKSGPKLNESDPAAAAEDQKAAAAGNLVRPRVTMGPDGFPQIPADANLPGTFVLELASGQFTRTKLFARHQTIDELADRIGAFLNRPVKNLTEIKGQYDFTLAFESDPRMAAPGGEASSNAPSVPAETGPNIFAAVQEQLGLKLEARRLPVEMLIVDRAEKVPLGN
jgi:uncharacterized protein (TIGR03435 family)